MPNFAELALVLFIMLVVFFANRMPAAADALGAAVKRLLHLWSLRRTPSKRSP